MRTQPLQQVHSGEHAQKSPAACGEPPMRVHTSQYKRAETKPDDEAEQNTRSSTCGASPDLRYGVFCLSPVRRALVGASLEEDWLCVAHP